MKVLVTGAAGFIGSNLVKRLLSENIEVVGVDNLNNYYNPRFKLENLNALSQNSKFFFIKLDLTDGLQLEKAFKKHTFDKIIHLAALAGVRSSINEPMLYLKNNIESTYNLLNFCNIYNVDHFIFASSSSVYGTNKVPFLEDQTVNTPLNPYALTKITGENLCFTFNKLYGVKTTVLRFFTVYGPSGRPDMAPYIFVKSALNKVPISVYGNGNATRDFTYVDDIVSGILLSLQKKFNFEIFNLGASRPVKLKTFISLIQDITKEKIVTNFFETRKGEVLDTYANVEKAKRMLGYIPKVNIELGLSQFTEWYKNTRLEYE